MLFGSGHLPYRTCFSVGDYIKVSSRFACIKGLFVHSRATSRYLFAVIDFIRPRTTGDLKELVLEVEIYEPKGSREIVGLTKNRASEDLDGP
jgi:hypothetical protein